MSSVIFHSKRIRIITGWFRRLCCLGWLAVPQLAPADTGEPNAGPPGSWVKPHFFDQQAPMVPDPGVDAHWLLLERQINAAEHETFFHAIRQIVTAAGVQKDSTLTVAFNPGCETLTLHWARLWRGKEHLERLDTNAVRIVQPEREMEQFILNGEKSAVLVLNDVRVGDIIDYAYSLKGANPVYSGHFAADFPMQLEQPADRVLVRVLWPRQHVLYAKPHGCTIQPKATVGTNAVEYLWDVRGLPGLALEDSVPNWFDPQPWVQLSDFKTWAQVNQWGLALFNDASPLSPGLSAQIAEWKHLETQEQQILAALRFVQDQVRYFGIEIGVSTVRPADPSTVFARRFGDCKDKSLLFVRMLRALGITAYPVLVNATVERAIADWEPSAGSFDHCIALVQAGGQNYWLDPTMNYQRGPLAAHYLPDYGCGLVLAPGTTALVPIPQTTGLPQTTTSEYYLLRGKTEPADLKVVTVAEGRDAESLRALFAETKRSDIEKNYTHFYSDTYPGIHMVSPITVEDDEEHNRFQTTESYAIEKPWVQPDKGGTYRCDFYPAVIAGLLKKPMDVNRKYPLGLHYPQHQFLHTEVALPQVWVADADQKAVSDDGFSFQKAYRCTGNTLIMEYEYRSLGDALSPDQVSSYVQRLNDAWQLLGYTLTWR